MDDVGQRRRSGGLWQRWQPSHALVMFPLALIVVITFVDLLVPADVHLGPLLVVAPALTASFAGPRLTAFIGALAVGAQAFIGIHFGVLNTRNVMVQIFSLALLTSLIVFFCRVREHRRRELAKVRSVAEAAQKALLRPLPTASARCGSRRCTWRRRTRPRSAATSTRRPAPTTAYG